MTQPLSQGSQSVEALIEEGRARLHSADRAGALKLLERAVALEPRNEQAWLHLAAAVETAAERRLCLQRVLAINPANQAVRRELEKIEPPAAPLSIRPVTAPLPQAAEPAAARSTQQLDLPRTWPDADHGIERQPALASPAPESITAHPVSEPSSQQHSGRQPGVRWLFRSLPAALYALIFMAFFLPFVTVSCGSMRENYSGIDLMSDNIEFESTGWFSEQLGYDFDAARGASARTPASAALLAAVVGLVATLVPHWIGRAVALAAGLSGLFALLLLRSGIERQLASPPLEGFVVVSYEGGYWLSLLLFGLGLSASLVILLIELSGRRPSLERWYNRPDLR